MIGDERRKRGGVNTRRATGKGTASNDGVQHRKAVRYGRYRMILYDDLCREGLVGVLQYVFGSSRSIASYCMVTGEANRGFLTSREGS